MKGRREGGREEPVPMTALSAAGKDQAGGDMNIGTIWGIAKVAATRIPWGRVMENIPAVVDLAERAKGRFRGHGGDIEARLRLLQEENRKLEQALLETSGHLQQTIRTLKVVVARQKMLMTATAVSLLVAIAALVAALR